MRLTLGSSTWFFFFPHCSPGPSEGGDPLTRTALSCKHSSRSSLTRWSSTARWLYLLPDQRELPARTTPLVSHDWAVWSRAEGSSSAWDGGKREEEDASGSRVAQRGGEDGDAGLLIRRWKHTVSCDMTCKCVCCVSTRRGSEGVGEWSNFRLQGKRGV